MENNRIYLLSNFFKKNLKNTKNIFKKILNKDINTIQINYYENTKQLDVLNLQVNNNIILLSICKKKEATEFAYKFWTYYYLKNINKNEINIFSKINMESYSLKKHHDILNISDENKKIRIKLHYIEVPELEEEGLISKKDLLVLLED